MCRRGEGDAGLAAAARSHGLSTGGWQWRCCPPPSWGNGAPREVAAPTQWAGLGLVVRLLLRGCRLHGRGRLHGHPSCRDGLPGDGCALPVGWGCVSPSLAVFLIRWEMALLLYIAVPKPHAGEPLAPYLVQEGCRKAWKWEGSRELGGESKGQAWWHRLLSGAGEPGSPASEPPAGAGGVASAAQEKSPWLSLLALHLGAGSR